MVTVPTAVVIGVFHDRRRVQSAIDALWRAGFSDQHLGLLACDGGISGAAHAKVLNSHAATRSPATGPAWLWSFNLRAAMLPELGPIVAGGFLSEICRPPGRKEQGDGLPRALLSLGMTGIQCRDIIRAVMSGASIVAVRHEQRLTAATAVLERYGAELYAIATPAHSTSETTLLRA